MSDQQLAVQNQSLMSYEDMQRMAESAAKSGMFGLTNPQQAICLFALCQAEGLNPIMALRRYHIIEGKPAMRADATLGEFEARGGKVIWHVRTDKVVIATFFKDAKKVDQAAIDRAKERCKATIEQDQEKLVDLSMPDEETIMRTFAECEEKGLTWSYKKNEQNQFVKTTKTNWERSPRQMLTARVITEGVGLIMSGLRAGIYSPEEIEDIDFTADTPVRVNREEVAEEKVKQAVANATGATKEEGSTSAPSNEVEKVKPSTRILITEENYAGVICHAGSEATKGKLFDCPVGKLTPKGMKWIIDVWAPAQHQPLNDMDAQLVDAVKVRLELEKGKAATQKPEGQESAPKEKVVVDKNPTVMAPEKQLTKLEKTNTEVHTGPAKGKIVEELTKEELQFYANIFTPKTPEDHRLQSICLSLCDDLPFG